MSTISSGYSSTVGVRMYAGAMPFTVTPSFALSLARANVMVCTAPFDDAYPIPVVTPPVLPASEHVLMIRPHFLSFIGGSSSRDMRNAESTFCAKMFRQSSMDVSAASVFDNTPQLLISTYTGAKSREIRWQAVDTDSALVGSKQIG
eukprot:CAMPEP_0185855982 /NCGR_PEP_ID=MMETSP1354-20130828/27433_1 /TAXON_ID=708628 /ORGANISM="Erythrolobus madagascarensis, Strain CCMP3276" /LENGTH=146 /DNA_ID=CAMNT_0028558113 /DNA_START=204 /DNA_END=644 /DNA_ORIENTATION=-